MNKFLDDLMQSNEFGEVSTPPVFKTGIDLLDYRNGRITYDSKGNKQITVGFNLGKIIGIIGKPGSAKTTLAIQIITNMMKQMGDNKDISAFHYDFERSTSDERVLQLSKETPDFLNQYIKFNSKIYQESVHSLLMKIRELKLGKPSGPKTKNPGVYDLSHAEKYLVEDPFNSGSNIMLPSFLLLDSISVMMPRDIILDEEQGTNMLAAAVAKANANFFRKIIGDLGDTMTTLFYVNHLTKKISINPMQPVSANINFLDPDENMPGGRVIEYLTDLLIKLKTGKKIKASEEFGIDGFLVEAKFAKSRSNKAGVACALVFNPETGYSNILSNYLLLKNSGSVKGGGRGFYLENYPERKFAQKEIETLYLEDKKFKKCFDQLLFPVLETYIPQSKLVNDPYEDSTEKEVFSGRPEKEIKKLPKIVVEMETDEGSIEVECYYDEKIDEYYDAETFEVLE